MSDDRPSLRELFTTALSRWREAHSAEDYSPVWELLEQAATYGREAYDVGAHFLKSPEAPYRAVGVDLLGCVADAHMQARPIVARDLLDRLPLERDIDVRWSIVTALGATAVPEVVPVLIDELSAEEGTIRAAAVQSLGAVISDAGATDDAVDALIKAMEDSEDGVGYWATYVVGTILESGDEKIHNALSRRLFDINNDVRLEAVVGLARRRDARVYTTVEQALMNPNVPARVFDAAFELADPRLVPHLRQADRQNISDEALQQVIDQCRAGLPIF